MSEKLTVDVVKALVPRSQKSMITQEIVDLLESGSNGDPDLIDAFKNSFISYINVLQTGKYKLTDYISAVKYVSYKLLNMSDMKAWIATFPDRYQRMIDQGKKPDDIAPHVSMYKNGKLVQQVYQQTVIPTHILNADLHQSTLNTLAGILNNTSYNITARVKAGDAILAHTKAPEVSKLEIDVGANQIDAIASLTDATAKLIETQKKMLQEGKISLKDLAETPIIEVEAEEVQTKNDEPWSL